MTEEHTQALVGTKDPYKGGIERLQAAWPDAQVLWVFPVLDVGFDAHDLGCVAQLDGTTVILATTHGGQPEALSRQFLEERLERYELAAELTRRALAVLGMA